MSEPYEAMKTTAACKAYLRILHTRVWTETDVLKPWKHAKNQEAMGTLPGGYPSTYN